MNPDDKRLKARNRTMLIALFVFALALAGLVWFLMTLRGPAITP